MPNLWGGGGSLITMPLTPWPAQIEIGKTHLAAANTNPFTATQQIQDWASSYAMGSVSLPPMQSTDGLAWFFFLEQLQGVVNVFQFMPLFAADAQYNYWLTSDGTLQKYWRLKNTDFKVTVKPGGIYNIVFDIRQAI